eukprot:1492844-Rhodomonas_salina.2
MLRLASDKLVGGADVVRLREEASLRRNFLAGIEVRRPRLGLVRCSAEVRRIFRKNRGRNGPLREVCGGRGRMQARHGQKLCGVEQFERGRF